MLEVVPSGCATAARYRRRSQKGRELVITGERSPASGGRLLGSVAAVFAGGIAGSLLRYLAGEAFPHELGEWPAAPLLVNLAGAFAIGVFLASRPVVARSHASVEFWAIGFLGSLTTFSAVSVEVFLLAESARFGMVAGYVSVSTAGGLVCAILGRRLGMARL